MQNLILRTITGIIFVILIISSVILNKYAFSGLFLLFTVLGMNEFYGLIERDDIKPQKIPGIITGAIVYIVGIISLLDLQYIIFWLSVFPMLFIIFVAEIYRKKENPYQNIGATITGVIYIAVPFMILNVINLIYRNDETYPEILLMLFFSIWINDTFAYATGSIFGRHKMFERISPKKTWEGFAGGIISALILTYILSGYFKLYSPIEWIGFTAVAVLASTAGDLSESLLKRSAGVKDSGNLFPGHGGILDRFDSVLLAAPFTLLYIIVLDYFQRKI